MQKNLFTEEYNKLNEAQKQAVESINGPVMVVAWPGTGKTQIIGLRTANIILKSWVNPDNILITTFTEAWVIAIRKRLLQFIWNEAYKVWVSTIHSFAQEVIKTFPEKFIEYKAGIAIDWVESLEITKHVLTKEIENKTVENLTNDFDPYLYLRDISSRIGSLKQEGVTLEKLEAITRHQEEQYKEELAEIKPELKKYNTTKEKQEKHIKKLEELKILFAEYNLYLRKTWKYDFNDMINFVLEKFRKDKELVQHYAEKYQYIMLDEYQDTNNAQNEIINQILSVSTPPQPSPYQGEGEDGPNIMVVGDDDQSIYRFQGANIENMLDFSTDYPGTKFVVLQDNYRSNQEILDLSTKLIENNSERIVNKIPNLEKKLISAKISHSYEGEYPKGEGLWKPKLLKANSDKEEKTFILNTIKEKISIWKPLNEIAIIVRNNREVEEYTSLLNQSQIETESKLKNDILKSNYINFIINYLKVIKDPYINESMFVDILRSQIVGLNSIDILKINRALYRENYSRKFKIKLIDFLSDEDKLIETWVVEKESLIAFRENLFSLWSDLVELNIIEFFNEFLKKTWILSYIESKSFDDIEDLYTFFNKIKNWASNNHNFNLDTLFTKLDLHKEYNYAIPRQILWKQNSGVQVLTAHSSKWLEYETVFIPWLYHWNWENKRIIDKLKLPPLSGDWIQDLSNKSIQTEEDRRLFFVAITRAKKELYLSYPAWIGNKPLLQSWFIEEISGWYEEIEFKDTDKKLITEVVTNELKNDLILYSHLELDYISEFLETYKLSASDLNVFLEDPKEFLNRAVFKYPFEDNQFTIFWKAYHRTLELFYLKYKNENKLPEKSYLTSTFSILIDKEVLTPEENEKLKQKGLEGLEGYYDLYSTKQEQPIALEYSFRHKNIVFEWAPLTWTIDKIELINSPHTNPLPKGEGVENWWQLAFFKEKVSLTDYKTGKIKTIGQIKWLDRYGNKKEWEGKYLRQLLFYKLLCENDTEFQSKFDIGSLNIDFVEWKDWVYKNIDVDYTSEEYEVFKTELVESWNKIKDINFWKALLEK